MCIAESEKNRALSTDFPRANGAGAIFARSELRGV
jgi:hypothetical protein